MKPNIPCLLCVGVGFDSAQSNLLAIVINKSGNSLEVSIPQQIANQVRLTVGWK